MRMVTWLCGYTIRDKTTNKINRDNMGVTPIQDKKREAILRWFGHVVWRASDAPIRRCERISSRDARGGRGLNHRLGVVRST